MKAGDEMVKYHLKKIVIFLLIIIIIAGTLSLLSCKSEGSEDGFETFEAIRGNIIQTVSTSGNVDSRYNNNYSLQTSGTVLKALEKGAAFNKGDILIELNSDRTQLLISQAEENIKISQASLDLAKISYQQALDSNHIAIQLAETNARQAELASKNAYKALENANNMASKSIGDSAKAQSRSSKDAAEGAYEQTVLSQSTAYWSNLSSIQAAEAQLAIVAKNIEQAELQLGLARISYELMVLDSDNHIIYAPYDGIVFSSIYKSGEYAGSGMSAIEIASSEYIIISEVNEIDIIEMNVGQQTIIGLDAYYLEELIGEIIKISPVSTNIGGVVSYKITVRPEVQDGIRLFHGMSVSLNIVTSDLENVIYVPIQSVREEDGKQYVDVLLEDANIERTKVETGIFNYDFIEIRSGLSEGDIVIVSGLSGFEQ